MAAVNSDNVMAGQHVVRRRLANVLGRADSVIVGFDGPVAGFEAAIDAEAFAVQALEYLRGTDGPYPFLLNFYLNGPLEILAYAHERGVKHALVVEGLLRDAELAAVAHAGLTAGAVEVLAACRETGRPVAVAGSVDIDAISAFLRERDLEAGVDHVLGRAELMRLNSGAEVAAHVGWRAQRTMLVSDKYSALRLARDGGLLPVGVVTRRSPRKHLDMPNNEYSAVVSNMTSLASAIRACPPTPEGTR